MVRIEIGSEPRLTSVVRTAKFCRNPWATRTPSPDSSSVSDFLGTSFMPQMGQGPGSWRITSGCMPQV